MFSTFPSMGTSFFFPPGPGGGFAVGLLFIPVFNTKWKGARMLPNVNLAILFAGI